MSAKLRLATTKDLARLEPMVAAFHGMEGISSDADHRRNALMPLLEGSAHGCVYLIGPDRAPVGYIVLSFGWSVELGGLDGFIDEFFIREAVRGRGMGREVLTTLLREMDIAGVRSIVLEVYPDNIRAQKLYGDLGFVLRDKYRLMARRAGALL